MDRYVSLSLKAKDVLVKCVYFSENFKDEDEFIMKAKMNFFATVVGKHPNVLEYIGGVVDHPSRKLH